LDEALATSRFVLVVGESKVGKSRSTYEAVRRVLPNRPLLVPANKASLPTLLSKGLKVHDTVVWLDNLETYLDVDGLTEHLLHTLVSDPARNVMIVATMRTIARDHFRPKGDLEPPEWKLLQQAREVRLARRLDDSERAHAKEQFTDERLVAALERYGLAEYLAAGPEMVQRFEDGLAVNPVGHALICAADDWRRTGLSSPISESMLRTLYPTYLADYSPEYLGDGPFQAGLAWAQERQYATSRLLVASGEGYAVFDYVLDYLERDRNDPIPLTTWEQAIAEVTPGDAANMLFQAVRHADPGIVQVVGPTILGRLVASDATDSSMVFWALGVLTSPRMALTEDHARTRALLEQVRKSPNPDLVHRVERIFGVQSPAADVNDASQPGRGSNPEA
jgi:eukaryotic-like serine/threonine-protein kinase